MIFIKKLHLRVPLNLLTTYELLRIKLQNYNIAKYLKVAQQIQCISTSLNKFQTINHFWSDFSAVFQDLFLSMTLTELLQLNYTAAVEEWRVSRVLFTFVRLFLRRILETRSSTKINLYSHLKNVRSEMILFLSLLEKRNEHKPFKLHYSVFIQL